MSAERDILGLIEQARAAHAKAMNCSDLAQEGAWTAHETVNGLPQNNYWAVMATRTPTAKGVEPFKVWKAHVNTPAMAGLLTFVSTALPQLCDLVERLQAERSEAQAALAVVRQSLQEQAEARTDPTMPRLVPAVLEKLEGDAEAAWALAETREDRVAAHGLSLLCEWQRAVAAGDRS